MKQIPFPYST